MKGTGILKRMILVALVVAAVMAVSAFSVSAEEIIAAGNYGQTTMDNVFFRKTASTGGDFWARLPAGWQLKVLGTTTTGSGDSRILWYKVQGGTPKAPARTYTGYVHSGYFTASGAPAATAVPAAEPSITAVPAASSGYVRTVKSGVNIRKTPDGTALTAKDENKIPYNTVLAYTEGPVSSGGYNWVKVSYKGITGYIRSDCWVQTDSSGQSVAPSIDTVTPVPAVPAGTDALGTITLTSGGVNFRATPNGSILGRLNKNTKLNYFGTQVVNSKELWYLAYSNDIGSYGYVLGTLAKVTSGATVPPAVTPTPTPGSSTPSGASAGVLVTTAGKLNLRKTPSLQAAVLVQIPNSNVTLNFSDTRVSGGITWYKVVYNGKTGWLHGSFVRVTSGGSPSGPTAKPSSPTTPVPDPSVFSNVAFTTADKVFIRKDPSMSGKQLTMVYKMGTKLTYNMRYQTDTTSNANTVYTWYNVTYNGTTGWMRGDFIRILTQAEKAAYDATGDPSAPAEASYTTLSKGSEGEAVRRLQQALADQGYLAASEVNGTYTTATEKAVIAFQKAHGLTQDGIAGEKTQHALFNTVPSGTYDGDSSGSVTPVLYPVEKIDWFTGGIQDIWMMGGTAVVTDVYTNKSFRMYRIYGGNHADVVPNSAEDTAVYLSLFNVSNAQEIDDRQNELQAWRRRPLWVTVGGRTFAASLYGVPHNYSDSAVINANNRLKNNFKGQVCIHFVNSKTHDSKTSKAHVDYDSAKNGNFGHQSAIQYAYTHSISGTK